MPTELKKALNVVQLTFYGVGTIIGAGIYSVIGTAAAEAGYNVWISFVFAAIAASFTALSYAELSSTFPKSGAEYVFLKNAFPKFRALSFTTGFFIAFHGCATIATVALSFAGYLNLFVPVSALAIAYSIIIFFTCFNMLGIRQSSFLNIALTSAQLIGLGILIFIGFQSPDYGKAVELASWDTASLTGIFAATSIIFFIYTGYEHMATLAEEAKNPGRDIPRAFIFSLVFTTIIYLLIVFSALALATPQLLGSTDSPLATAASKYSPLFGKIIGIAALCATANATMSGTISLSRLLFGMARDGDMPRKMANVNSRKSPWVTAVIVFIAVSLLLPLGEIKFVASLSSLGAILVFVAVNASLIVMRYKFPDIERPFKTPISIGKFPVLPAFGVLISLFLLTQYSWQVYVGFAIAAGVGFLIYTFGGFTGKPVENASDIDIPKH